MKVLKKNPISPDDLGAGRIAALSKRAGRLANANRKQGYH